jgi:hypothetical protein
MCRSRALSSLSVCLFALLMRLNKAPFNLERVEEIVSFLAKARVEKEEVLYELSLELEPRDE